MAVLLELDTFGPVDITTITGIAAWTNNTGMTQFVRVFAELTGLAIDAVETLTFTIAWDKDVSGIPGAFYPKDIDQQPINKAAAGTVFRWFSFYSVPILNGGRIQIKVHSSDADDDTVSGSVWLFSSNTVDVYTMGLGTPMVIGDISALTNAAKLASDGLDSVSKVEPLGAPSGWNFRQWLIWGIKRFANKHIHDRGAGTLKVRDDGDAADMSSQNVTVVGAVETVEKVS